MTTSLPALTQCLEFCSHVEPFDGLPPRGASRACAARPPYKYEVDRIKTHEMRAKYFISVIFSVHCRVKDFQQPLHIEGKNLKKKIYHIFLPTVQWTENKTGPKYFALIS